MIASLKSWAKKPLLKREPEGADSTDWVRAMAELRRREFDRMRRELRKGMKR